MPDGNVTGEICPPSKDSSNVHHSVTRKRAWKRNRARWTEWRVECASGSLLADLAEAGRARPYELGDVRRVLLDVLSRPALDLLEWLLAAELGFRGKRGIVLRHDDARRLLRVSRRRAGDAMRELVRVGLVQQRPHFRQLSDTERLPQSRQDVLKGPRKLNELTPAYQTTKRCRQVVLRRAGSLVGRKSQPAETHLSLRDRRKVRPGRGPALAFRAELGRTESPWKLRDTTLRATVLERRPDGTIALGSLLTADTFSLKLRREGREVVKGSLEEATLRLLASFEAAEARKGRGQA